MRRLNGLVLILALAGAHGCSSSPATGGDGGGGADLAGTANGNLPLPANAKIGTYIPLGDSISDRGGIGPFFYDLLLKNDDTAYPNFTGHDLTGRFPGVVYEHDAVAGAITDLYQDGLPSGAPTLKSQITKLGHGYAGDVLITITIGGNDLNGHAFAAIGGNDMPLRAELAAHLADELGELTTPGRLGTGKVYIVLANIYDFTDGMGDFATVMCGPPLNVMPAKDLMVFNAWNAVLGDATGHAGGTLYDMHADFMGHGYNNADVWFDRASCIHPNAKGHNAIRSAVWKLVTGETP